MLNSKFLLTTFFLICFQCHLTFQQERVKVSVFYEALCPYCRNFIHYQLYPTYKIVGDDAVELNLVAYGESKHEKVNGEWIISCLHGPAECYANKLHGCTITDNYTQAEGMNFVGCLMSSDNPGSDANAEQCADEFDLPWEKIKECANGEEGERLFIAFGDETDELEPPLDDVPYILFNDKYNETLLESARLNFMKTLCSLYKNPPNGC